MSRSYVLGIDGALYVQPASLRNENIPSPDPQSFALVATAQNVVLGMGTRSSQVRGRRTYVGSVVTRSNQSVTASVLWQPDDSVFAEMLTAHLQYCPLTFIVLDANLQSAGRCEETEVISGLMSDFNIATFDRNESLEGGMITNVVLETAMAIVPPQWVVI